MKLKIVNIFSPEDGASEREFEGFYHKGVILSERGVDMKG